MEFMGVLPAVNGSFGHFVDGAQLDEHSVTPALFSTMACCHSLSTVWIDKVFLFSLPI